MPFLTDAERGEIDGLMSRQAGLESRRTSELARRDRSGIPALAPLHLAQRGGAMVYNNLAMPLLNEAGLATGLASDFNFSPYEAILPELDSVYGWNAMLGQGGERTGLEYRGEDIGYGPETGTIFESTLRTKAGPGLDEQIQGSLPLRAGMYLGEMGIDPLTWVDAGTAPSALYARGMASKLAGLRRLGASNLDISIAARKQLQALPEFLRAPGASKYMSTGADEAFEALGSKGWLFNRKPAFSIYDQILPDAAGAVRRLPDVEDYGTIRPQAAAPTAPSTPAMGFEDIDRAMADDAAAEIVQRILREGEQAQIATEAANREAGVNILRSLASEEDEYQGLLKQFTERSEPTMPSAITETLAKAKATAAQRGRADELSRRIMDLKYEQANTFDGQRATEIADELAELTAKMERIEGDLASALPAESKPILRAAEANAPEAGKSADINEVMARYSDVAEPAPDLTAEDFLRAAARNEPVTPAKPTMVLDAMTPEQMYAEAGRMVAKRNLYGDLAEEVTQNAVVETFKSLAEIQAKEGGNAIGKIRSTLKGKVQNTIRDMLRHPGGMTNVGDAKFGMQSIDELADSGLFSLRSGNPAAREAVAKAIRANPNVSSAEAVEGGLQLTMKNGAKGIVSWVDDIDTPAHAAMYSSTAGKKVGGRFIMRVDGVGEIDLTRFAGISTPDHEFVHWAKALGLFKDDEWASLVKRFGDNEEAIAAGLEGEPALFQRIKDWFARLYQDITGQTTGAGTVEKWKRGDIFSRSTEGTVQVTPRGTGGLYRAAEKAGTTMTEGDFITMPSSQRNVMDAINAGRSNQGYLYSMVADDHFGVYDDMAEGMAHVRRAESSGMFAKAAEFLEDAIAEYNEKGLKPILERAGHTLQVGLFQRDKDLVESLGKAHEIYTGLHPEIAQRFALNPAEVYAVAPRMAGRTGNILTGKIPLEVAAKDGTVKRLWRGNAFDIHQPMFDYLKEAFGKKVPMAVAKKFQDITNNWFASKRVVGEADAMQEVLDALAAGDDMSLGHYDVHAFDKLGEEIQAQASEWAKIRRSIDRANDKIDKILESDVDDPDAAIAKVMERIDRLQNELTDASEALIRSVPEAMEEWGTWVTPQGLDWHRDFISKTAGQAWEPALKEMDARRMKLNRGVLEYVYRKGMLSSDEFAFYVRKGEFYTPLQRLFDDDEVAPMSKALTLFKKFIGSERDIDDPVVGFVTQMHKAISKADKNEAYMLLAREVMENPTELSEVVRIAQAPAGGKLGADVAGAVVDGKTVYLQFMDPNAAKQYEAINRVTNRTVAKEILKMPAKLLRSAVTLDPFFALFRNPTRDIMNLPIVSQADSKSIDVLKGIAGRTADEWDEFYSAGGQFGGWAHDAEAHYTRALSSHLRKLSGDKRTVVSTLDDLSEMAGKGVDWMEDLTSKSESVTRITEYKNAIAKLKKMYPDAKEADLRVMASRMSGELLDFNATGEWISGLAQYIPFFNARMQGTRTLFRAIKNDPVHAAREMTLKMGMLSIGSYMMAQAAGRGEEYRSLPAYRRDFYWNIPGPGNYWITVPKPFEAGVVGTLFERLVDLSAGNPTAMDGWVQSFGQGAMPLTTPDIAGPLRPIIEVLANKDLFRDDYIVPPYEEGLDVRLRAGAKKSSGIAKLLAAATGGVIPGLEDPRQWEHLIASQFAAYGRTALDMTSQRAGRTAVKNLTGGLFRKTSPWSFQGVQDALEDAKAKGMTRDKAHRAFVDKIKKTSDNPTPGNISALLDAATQERQRVSRVTIEDILKRQKAARSR